MEDYGFILVTKEEAINMDLPDGTGLFVELYNSMEHELKMNPTNKNYGKSIYMSPEERKISFMNRYFVFKKIRSVDVKKMEEIIVNNEKETADVIETIIDNKPNKSSKKTNKKKIILQKIEVVEQ
jgi:hypothetical protein